MAARLLFGLLAQLAGEIGEPVQCGIDADQGEIGLDDLQVKVRGTANSNASAAMSSSVRVAASASAACCSPVRDSSGVRPAKTAVAHAVAGIGSTPT